jgi:hypothetical protein
VRLLRWNLFLQVLDWRRHWFGCLAPPAAGTAWTSQPVRLLREGETDLVRLAPIFGEALTTSEVHAPLLSTRVHMLCHQLNLMVESILQNPTP